MPSASRRRSTAAYECAHQDLGHELDASGTVSSHTCDVGKTQDDEATVLTGKRRPA